ncbi:MAG: Fic family protein [Prolixibacteraceae bacterium]|nr:Fic family protein [Prolixibacteraceae bacterium]
MTYQTTSIGAIDLLKTELEKLIPISEVNNKKLKKKFRLEFNYNSNHLEGNTLTYGQTQLLLLFDKSSGDVPVSDIEEMKAHDTALTLIEEMAKEKDRPLTEQFVKELNKMILVKPFWKDAINFNGTPTRKKIEIGQYKTFPNSVRLRNGEIHEYASPEETPAKMGDLISWYHDNLDTMHPVQLAAEFHYKFVCIHPFDDGNGRVARLIMNYILLKNDYPQVIIKVADKENYLTALQKADTGNVLALIEYIEKQMIWSLELSIKAAKGEEIQEYGDIEKEIEILKREKLTKSKIFKTPKVSFEVFNHVNDELWNPLNNFLSKFDDFFAETYNEEYIDGIKIEKTKTIHSPLLSTQRMFSDRVVTIKKYVVFGHYLEEEDISGIQWERKMLSLKSASKKIDFCIDCTLHLNESTYKLTITESNTDSPTMFKNKTSLFEAENEYKTWFMDDAIEGIIRIVSNHMLEIIKSDQES